jgi:hypothetical protein
MVSFYRIGDVLRGSGAGVKLETMRMRLPGGPHRAVAVHFRRPLEPVDRLVGRASGHR